MPDQVYKIRPRREVLSEISFEVRLGWTLGILSALLRVPKKQLRLALAIIKEPELEAEILEKGKPVKRIFRYGFRAFTQERKGKKRQILAPHPSVQQVFKGIKDWLESLSVAHPNAFGFVKDKNPKKAVATLLGNKHFVGFDIAGAFPSITVEMVAAALERLRVSEAIIDVLAWLVTCEYEHQRRLPQGSSCSPILLNLVYRPMCEDIQEICSRYGISWHVYVDDFNFASFSISPKVKAELLAVPVRYGFALKEQKTRDNFGKTIPRLLGLTIVDGQLHIGRQAKNRIRRIIYAATTQGAYSAEQVRALIGYVRHIYGEEANWPGSLLRVYQRYRAERRTE